MSQSLLTRFAEIAASHAARPAVVLPAGENVQSVTYAELDCRRLEIADALASEHQVAAGENVGIVESQEIDTIAAMLGIITAGASYVPLDPELPEERLEFIRDDANVRVTLSAEAGLVSDSISISDLRGERREFADIDPDSCLYVMFTSGSTGTPKGVMIPHRAVHRLVVGANFMTLDDSTRFLQLAPQSFDAATLEIWGPLLNGGVLVMYPEKVADPDTLRRVLRSQQVNSLWLTAALFNQFVSRWPDTLDSVSTILFGGERASLPHVRAAFERYTNSTLINGYGPTENTTFTCCHTVTAEDIAEGASELPIGRPISGTVVKVIGKDGVAVKQGETGELIAGGSGVALGYLNREDLTSASFFTDDDGGHWYRTGDLACEREDGAIQYFGRMDRQLKISGHRIEPGEIEVAIMNIATLRNAYVVAMETPNGDAKLAAYIVGEADIEQIRQKLAKELPQYMIPSVFVALEELPVTTNGKVDTASLPNPFAGSASVEQLQSGSETANTIAAIWAEVVSGLSLTSFDENFFDAGGSSMDMLRVKKMLEERLNMEIPAVTLFTYPTVNKLANHLSPQGESQAADSSIRERARQRRQNLSRRKKRQSTV